MRSLTRFIKAISVVYVLSMLCTAGAAFGEAESLGHYQLHGKEVPLGQDGIHDPNNDALEVLQPPYSAMAAFPRRSNGVIDWMATLDDGLINPRVDLAGE